jgi:ATP-dependent helicase/nuclease subunit A
MSELNPRQRDAAYCAGSVALTAGAGTGKTHVLAERYQHLLTAN